MTDKETPTFFVLGCERSGTTVLQRVLARHYDLAHGGEAHWIVPFWHIAQKSKLNTIARQKKFFLKIFSTWTFANLANYHKVYFDHNEFIQQGHFNYPKFVRHIFQYICNAKQKKGYIDKTCILCEHMPIVNKIFHTPRIVHVVRDGRDVALSLMRVKGWGPKTPYGAACWWVRRVNGVQKYAAENANCLYREIKYEKLLSDPASTFESIAKFYDIYDDKKHAKLVDSLDIKRQNSDKWRLCMRSIDINIFERIAGNTLKRNNYALANNGNSFSPLSSYAKIYYESMEYVAGKSNIYFLWFKMLQMINHAIGHFPGFQQRFFRTSVFRKFFDWNRIIKR